MGNKLDAELAKMKSIQRYKLLSTLLGTILVSVVGSYLVFVENTEKNRHDFDDRHREFVAKFVELAIDEDIETRQRLARYFASVTLDDSQRSRWAHYADYIDRLIKDNPREIASMKKRLDAAPKEERDRMESRIQFLERQMHSTAGRANIQTDFSKDCVDKSKSYPAQWICIAKEELALGVVEVPGPGSNPRILEYAEYATRDSQVLENGDDIPWSGLFVAWVLSQSGIDTSSFPANPYHNRQWLQFGSEAITPQPGMIAIFWQISPDSPKSTIGFYDGEDDGDITIISGNIRNSISRIGIAKHRLLGYRTLLAQ